MRPERPRPISVGMAWTALLLLSFVLAGGEALRGLTRLLTTPAGGVLLLGVVHGFRGLTGADTGLTLGLVQRLLDQSQHELPLGDLAARAGCLALQVRLDPLEKVLLSAPSVNQYL